jgi:hypothetical protein
MHFARSQTGPKTFVVRPHSDLGRAGPVCPFVPVALDHKTLWFAAERSAGRNPPDVIQLIEGYKRLLLAAQPVEGDDASYKSIVVVFTSQLRPRISLAGPCSKSALHPMPTMGW